MPTPEVIYIYLDVSRETYDISGETGWTGTGIPMKRRTSRQPSEAVGRNCLRGGVASGVGSWEVVGVGDEGLEWAGQRDTT